MSTCIFCSREIYEQQTISFLLSFKEQKQTYLCKRCFDKFQKINPDASCPTCSRSQISQNVCPDCKKWQKNYPKLDLKHTALFRYNNIAKEYMEIFKFQGDLVLAEVFALEVQEALKKFGKTYLIVPIPISHSSQKIRGFNQVELFLQKAGLPYENFLAHMGSQTKQSSKNKEERLAMKQPFELLAKDIVKQHYLSQKSSKNILLVDDVYTTGRTILHARILLNKELDAINMRSGNSQELYTESFSLFR